MASHHDRLSAALDEWPLDAEQRALLTHAIQRLGPQDSERMAGQLRRASEAVVDCLAEIDASLAQPAQVARAEPALAWEARTVRPASMPSANEQTHWRRTTKLMLVHLGVLLFFGLFIHAFVHVLNDMTIPILKFPLGYYMAAQGSLIAFVVQVFVFAWQQDRIDREHGLNEEEEFAPS